MTKKRVHELSKEVGISSKDLISILKEMNIDVKNHMSTLEEEDVKAFMELNKPMEEENKKNEVVVEEIKENVFIDKIDTNFVAKSKIKTKASKDKDDIHNKKKHKLNKGGKSKVKDKLKDKPEEKKFIKLPSTITVGEFAKILKLEATAVIKKLIPLGIMAAIHQEIDYDTAALIAEELGYTVSEQKSTEETLEERIQVTHNDDENLLEPRPPVVTVMGHVDHGKTSLLDAIRHAKVTESEAGGITQHIGAYQTEIKNKKVVFLDTPGHEAFTALRARGAKVTDIAVLVVAADDGVMPQTIEAINHAKAANVPIIVAINKIDKAGANPDRVKQELSNYGLVPEEWGGETIMVPVSAVKKLGLDTLLEMIVLVADISELKSNYNRLADGTIIESKLDKGRGPVATVLIKGGILNIGDHIVAGSAFGKVRAMIDDKGRRIKKAGPSSPVEIQGLNDVPVAGDMFYAVEDDKTARTLAEIRKAKTRESELKQSAKVSLQDLFNQIKEGKVKDLNIIVKADVQGSIEALKQSLNKLSNEEVRVNLIHSGVGAISETDIMLASASNAIVIGFNVRPDTNSVKLAEKDNVDIRLYRIIYNAIEDIEAAMKGMLDPDIKEVINGKAEVRTTFKVPGVGTIAGCYVTEGKILRNSTGRVIRNGIVIFEGKLSSLKRFKDDVREVVSGYECGIGLERFNDIKDGDIIESFSLEEVAR
jgi:translation initiation factor IF-2